METTPTIIPAQPEFYLLEWTSTVWNGLPPDYGKKFYRKTPIVAWVFVDATDKRHPLNKPGDIGDYDPQPYMAPLTPQEWLDPSPEKQIAILRPDGTIQGMPLAEWEAAKVERYAKWMDHLIDHKLEDLGEAA
jgi:hypothetical protein